tara:strand:- start:338 stop:463 length:126 start_codon:yes stop_codon:yes gene_type:complete
LDAWVKRSNHEPDHKKKEKIMRREVKMTRNEQERKEKEKRK